MPELRYIVELNVFLGKLYFKYEFAGKCHRKKSQIRGEHFKNVCMKGQKIVTTATM